jgi:hypothetical protein
MLPNVAAIPDIDWSQPDPSIAQIISPSMHHRNWCNFTCASCQTRCAEALSLSAALMLAAGTHRKITDVGSDIATRTFDKSLCFP